MINFYLKRFDHYVMTLFDTLLLWLWNNWEITKLTVEAQFLMAWTIVLTMYTLMEPFSIINWLVYIMVVGLIWKLDFVNRRRDYISIEAENLRVMFERITPLVIWLRWISYTAIIWLAIFIIIYSTHHQYYALSLFLSVGKGLVFNAFEPKHPPRRRKKEAPIKLLWTPALQIINN